MSNERDPRTDPRPGDEVEWHDGTRYEVTARDGEYLEYTIKRPGRPHVTQGDWILCWLLGQCESRVVARGADRSQP